MSDSRGAMAETKSTDENVSGRKRSREPQEQLAN
jgi:hypothetical protein